MSERTPLPFSRPDIGEDEIAEVVDSLRSGWLTTGPKARKFEEEFAAFLGGEVQAMAVNSATAGLHLALEAVGVGPGDEVVTTPYTFTATAEVVRYLGAHPVFVDVDPTTLNINPDLVESAVTERTKAIIPVHIGGLACDMAAIVQVANRHRVKVIEDAAHALPATSGGRLVGSLDGDATVFSFYATKTITTGEGGMVVTREPSVAERCRVMRLHGIDRDAFDRYVETRPSWYYEVVAPGFKYNMTDIAASLGLHQLRKAHAFQKRREEIAEAYSDEFAELPVTLPARAAPGELHAWHLYLLRLRDGASVDRDGLIARLAAEGIGTSVHFIPLNLHPYWSETYGLTPDDFPNAVDAYRRVTSLPIYSRMSDEDVDRVVRAVRDSLS